MKRLLSVLMALSLLLSLAACGSAEPDPNAGVYRGISATVMGCTMAMEEVYAGETWLELKSGGKGTIMLDGDDFACKWALDGETITITVSGEDSVGTLKDGLITVDLLDMGCIMTFLREGSQLPEPEVTHNHAGFYQFLRIDSQDPDLAVSEEDQAVLNRAGVYNYLELREDGTGEFWVEEPTSLSWEDGSISMDGLSLPYTLEGDLLTLPFGDMTFVLRKTEKNPEPVSEMEEAGFTEFMEVGVISTYYTHSASNPEIAGQGDALVTSYEIFESAEGYPARDGYEWRVADMEVTLYAGTGENVTLSGRIEDYYNTRLLDATSVWEDDVMNYQLVHEGRLWDAMLIYTDHGLTGWHWENGKQLNRWSVRWAYQVPVGYDGAVAGLIDCGLNMEEGTSVVDYAPEHFLFFRLDG